MFFDGYDLYVGASVLGSAVQTKFAVLAQVPQFISWTFVGMTIGSVIAGFLGDRFGRRFTYQFNLVVFGLASFAAAAAPSMDWLIAARFVMGLGLGAEIVVGYSTMTEFVPPASRGRWMAFMAFIVVAGFPGHLDHQHARHPGIRLAADVRDRRRRRADRLVPAQEPAREPALAREPTAATAEAEALMQAIEARGVGRQAAAAAGAGRADAECDLRLAVQRRPAAAADRRLASC